MPIRPGGAWGADGALPADGVVVRSDIEARLVVEGARRDGRDIPTVGLLGGDLCRTLGGTGDERRLREGGVVVEVDVGAALLDGRLHWFVAHLVARRGWWRGPIVALMNAQFVGEWDVAPRAHPGDGKLDQLSVSMPASDRLQARTRLRSGTHVPHPGIHVSQVTTAQLEFERDTPIRLDGEVVARARSVSVRVEPAALRVVV